PPYSAWRFDWPADCTAAYANRATSSPETCRHARRHRRRHPRVPARPRRPRAERGTEGRAEVGLSRDRRDGRPGAPAARPHGRAGACLRVQRGGSGMSASPIPTIAEAARLIAAKELSPVELTRACLDRVQALDGKLHAFVHV